MNLPENNQETLLIFTRYPLAGKSKTRLIPALGAAGAANLQKHLTQYTLKQIKELKKNRSISLVICYAGGSRELMQTWLGGEFFYYPQIEGDLGQRMAQAVLESRQAGAERTIIIGTDCPELNAELLADGFNLLQKQDLILGPATDGGYYLIGLRRFIPELFTGISWGTEKVLQQTLEKAQQLNLSVTLLPELGDIDRPEDLKLLPLELQVLPSTGHNEKNLNYHTGPK